MGLGTAWSPCLGHLQKHRGKDKTNSTGTSAQHGSIVKYSRVLRANSETFLVALVGTQGAPLPPGSELLACEQAQLYRTHAVRAEASCGNSIPKLLRKPSVINLTLYLQIHLNHQGSKQHKTQRTKKKENKSKLTEIFDLGILTNS